MNATVRALNQLLGIVLEIRFIVVVVRVFASRSKCVFYVLRTVDAELVKVPASLVSVGTNSLQVRLSLGTLFF